MAETPMVMVFCYDVENNRRRRRVAAVLEEWGVRVQKSVFEARLTERQSRTVLARAARELGPRDSLRMYAVSAHGLTRTATIGGAPVPEQKDFWLL